MKRALRIVAHLLAVIIVLAAMGLIVVLIHYAIYGNPIKDTQHIINGIKRTSVTIPKPGATKPAPTTPSSSPYSTDSSNTLFTGKAAPASEGSVAATPTTEGNAEAPAAPSNDKYDGDCPTPPAYATVGRCADKCPNFGDTLLGFDPTTGAAICQSACPAPEFIRGMDKTTGAPICGYVTGCPYGDSVPLGPMCYKNCLNTNPQAATDPTVCYQGTGYSG